MRDIRTDKLIAIAVTSMLAAGGAAVAATGISANASEHGQGIEAVAASAPTSFTIADGDSRADSYLISSLILARDEDGHDVIEEISPSDAISTDGESGGMVIQVPDNGEYDLDPADNAISFPKLMVSYAEGTDVKLDELGNGQHGYKVTASLDGITQFYVIRFETDLGDGGGSDEPAADGVLSHLTINDRVFTASEINQAKTEEGLTLDEKIPFDENNQMLISAGFTNAEPDQYRLDTVTSGNVLTIDVIDDEGGTVAETLTITFLQGGDDTPSQGDQTDATLASIDIMGHMVDVDAAASPDGATLVLSHEEFMEFDVEKDVTATPTQSGKGTSINGHYDGVTGILTITVTAPDQVTKKQYKVTLVDEEASDESLQLKSVSWGTDSTNRVSLSAAEVMNGSITVEYPSGVEPSNSDVICELVDDGSKYSVEYDEGNSRFDITVTNSSGESITYRLPVRTSDLSDEDRANSTVSRIVITGRDGVEHVIEGSNLDAAASPGGYTLLLDKDAIGETTDLEIRVTPSVVGQPNVDTKLDGNVLTLTQRSIDGQHSTVYTINLDYGDTGDDDDDPVQQEISFKIELPDGTVGTVTCTEGMTYREALTGAGVDFDEGAEYVDAEGSPVDLDSEARDGITLKAAEAAEMVAATIGGKEHEFTAGTTYEALDELGYDYTSKVEEGYTFDLFDKTSSTVVKPTDTVTDGADVTVTVIAPDAPAVEISVSTYDALTDRLIGTGAVSFETDDKTSTVGTLMNRLKKIFLAPDHSASKYEFVEWRYEDGTPVDEGASVFDIIDESDAVSFYAHYEKTETGGEDPGDGDEQVTVTINNEVHTFAAGTTYAEALDEIGYDYTNRVENGYTFTLRDTLTNTVVYGNDIVTDGANITVGLLAPPVKNNTVHVGVHDTVTNTTSDAGETQVNVYDNSFTIGDLLDELGATLTAPNHNGDGYEFVGWYYDDGTKVDVNDLLSDIINPIDNEHSVVFYAHYEKIGDGGDDGNGGSGNEDTNTPSGSEDGQDDGIQGNENQPGTDDGESGGNAGSDNENGAGNDTQDGGSGTVAPDGEYGDDGQLAQSGKDGDGTGGVAGEAPAADGSQLTQTGAETALPVALAAIVSAFAAAAAFARRRLTSRK